MAGQTVVVSVLSDTRQFETGMKAAGGMTKGLLVGVGALAVGVGAWIGSTTKDMLRVERLGANTAAVIAATGGAAGKSAVDVKNYADKFEALTGMEAETVTEGQNVLLTFKSIKGQNFDKATASAADLAVWMNKGSLEGANMAGTSTMLGKALENPTKGLTALTKVGVTFTDQEKEQIKTLQAKGDLAGAQALILKAVNGQVAGSAVAAGKTTEGMWTKITNSLGNVSEEALSGALPALTTLGDWFIKEGMPAVKGFGDWITANVMPALTSFGAYITGTVVPALVGFGQWLSANKDWLLAVGISVGILVGAFQTWMAVTKAAAAVQLMFNLVMSANPIALVIIAIAALVAGLVYFFTQTEMGRTAWAAFTTFIGVAWEATSTVLSNTWKAISKAFSAGVSAVGDFMNKAWAVIKKVWEWSPLGIIVTNWGAIMSFFGGIPGKVQAVFSAAISWLVAAGTNILKGLQTGATTAWNTVNGWLGGIPGKIKDVFDGAIGWLSSAGRNLLSGLWNGISDKVGWIYSKIRGMVNSVIDYIKGLFGVHSPSTVMADMGVNLLKGLEKGLRNTTGVENAMSRVSDNLTGAFAPELALAGIGAGAGGKVTQNYYSFDGLSFAPANAAEANLLEQFSSMLQRKTRAGV